MNNDYGRIGLEVPYWHSPEWNGGGVVIIGGGGGVLPIEHLPNTNPIPNPIVCAQDVKVCANGKTVKRDILNDCDFFPCETVKNETDDSGGNNGNNNGDDNNGDSNNGDSASDNIINTLKANPLLAIGGLALLVFILKD